MRRARPRPPPRHSSGQSPSRPTGRRRSTTTACCCTVCSGCPRRKRHCAARSRWRRSFRTLIERWGAILINECRIDEAIDTFRRGRAHDPQNFDLESAELFALNLAEDATSEAILARHQAFGARLEAAYPPRFVGFANSKEPERRLRVGYLSPDFCNHGVGLFMLPLVEQHDRAACEVVCYSVGTVVDDATRSLQNAADAWRDATALSHAELADAIHRDGIDILVDLAGHSGARLPVFALAPAPVQASWLGYLCTTGLSRIQYRLCDAVTDPQDAQRLHTETLVRLPGSQWCYRPRPALDYSLAAQPPRAKNGYVTFGSFNHAPKLSPSVLRMWARIMAGARDARLLLVGVPAGAARDTIAGGLASAGIATTRLDIVGRVSLQEYFQRLNEVDLALDTTPYSGGTTTCDALWMGVPVLTLPGSRPVSRSAAGILSVAELSRLDRDVAGRITCSAPSPSPAAAALTCRAEPTSDNGYAGLR
jgi:predicted O-linked N-acetylglucosamine transferase (SPINDLY family)